MVSLLSVAAGQEFLGKERSSVAQEGNRQMFAVDTQLLKQFTQIAVGWIISKVDVMT